MASHPPLPVAAAASHRPLPRSLRIFCLRSTDHNQILGGWYTLYAGWSDAPPREEWVRVLELRALGGHS
eukprot:636356-Pleurochrysis_carterae.AAC.3